MEKDQIAKNNMYVKVDDFCNAAANSTILSSYARLATEIGTFAGKKSQLEGLIQQQQLDIKGITQGKNALWVTLCNLAINAAHKGYIWALDNNNSNLKEIFDVHKSDFFNVSQNVAYVRAKNIRDSITPAINAMSSVELAQSDLDALNDAITAYENTLGTPGTAKAHKTQATQAIEALMHPIDQSLDNMERLIVSHFSGTNSAIVEEFLINRHIDALPTHHSGVHATVTDATNEMELSGAVLSIVDVNGNVLKTSTSDIDGIAEIIKIKNGTYNAVVSLAGYQSQTTRVEIKRGRVVDLEVGLVR